MPTGYTAGIEDGSVTTLKDYALRCARGFGALITMRDDDSNAPIPDKLEASTSYHDEHLAEAEKSLNDVSAMKEAECWKKARSEFDEEMKRHNEYQKERIEIKARYAAMKELTEDWSAPAEVGELKKFMLDQINLCTRGDYKPDPPVMLTGESWRAKTLEKASRDIAYHTKTRDEELERTKGRNKWLSDLRDSL